jgi:hypothetical protein
MRQLGPHHVDLAGAGMKPDDFPWLAREPGASFSVDADRAARTPAIGLRTKITHRAPRQITDEQPTRGIRESHHHVPPHIESRRDDGFAFRRPRDGSAIAGYGIVADYMAGRRSVRH